MSEPEPELDWSQAKVKGGKLSVPVVGEVPRGWNDTFEKTAQLLSRGEWESVRLKKDTVRVEGIESGSEDKLRHFLESVLLQANSTHQPRDEEAGDDREDSDGSSDGDDEHDSADSEMTERFRSFAASDHPQA